MSDKKGKVMCGKCKLELPEDDNYAACRLCNLGYHFETCSMKASSWRGLGRPGQANWVCPSCRSKERSHSQSLEDDSVADGISAKLDSLMQMKNSIIEIEKSMTYHSAHYEEILKELKDLRKENAGLKEEVNIMKRKQTASDAVISDLQDRLNELEQYGRRVNLEIHGVPVQGGRVEEEKTEEVVKELAKKINVDYAPREVHKLHRLQKRKDGQPPAIIVQFHSTVVRDNWLLAGKKARLTDEDTRKKIFFNENLTRYYKGLLFDTKDRCKMYQYKYVWFSNGRIKVRKDENDRNILVIRNRDDMNRIGA